MPPSPTILLTLLSLILILNLLPHSPRSIFSSHIPRNHLTIPRSFEQYQFSKTCSPAARRHFRDRLTSPTIPVSPVTTNSSFFNNRLLLSPIPLDVGDGLGHRFCFTNFEKHLANVLGLLYTHRKSRYGALTSDDPDAVENLFGWGYNELSRDAVLRSCTDVRFVEDTCGRPGRNVVCGRLKSTLHGGVFDYSVFIPPSIVDCVLVKEGLSDACINLVKTFLATYSQPNTLFQIQVQTCFHEYFYTNFSSSIDWFRGKYWKALQTVEMDFERVQIGVHIRRGDFFNYTNRVSISDNTFADVVWRVKQALDEIVGNDVPTDVHIFSEGVANGRLKDIHDIKRMKPYYLDHHGNPIKRPKQHWKTLLSHHRRAKNTHNMRVFTHIAENTLSNIRMMLSSDVFVGSVSGLSMHLVRVLGRGVMVLPMWEGDVDQQLVVPFDWSRNGFDSFLDEPLLYNSLANLVRRCRIACAVW